MKKKSLTIPMDFIEESIKAAIETGADQIAYEVDTNTFSIEIIIHPKKRLTR